MKAEPRLSTRLFSLLNRNINLLWWSAAVGGELERQGVERIYHHCESASAHKGVVVNMRNKVGVGFLRQITVIGFGSFPRSVMDRYAEKRPLGTA